MGTRGAGIGGDRENQEKRKAKQKKGKETEPGRKRALHGDGAFLGRGSGVTGWDESRGLRFGFKTGNPASAGFQYPKYTKSPVIMG